MHNGGTWFISCLIISYMFYPVIRGVLFRLNRKTLYIITAIMMFLLVYLPAIGYYYGIGTLYSNPVFRCLEFIFGVLISNCSLSFSSHIDDEKHQISKNVIGSTICVFGFILFVYLLAFPMPVGNAKLILTPAQLMMYPYFMFLLCAGLIMRSNLLENNRLLRYLSGLIYYFFILQLFVWTTTNAVTELIRGAFGFDLSSNSGKLLLSFSICLLMSIIVCELFDKPVKAFLLKNLPVFKERNI